MRRIARLATVILLVTGLIATGGCRSAVHRLQIPLGDASIAAAPASDRVSIEDLRPIAERRPHRGKQVMSCEDWFGDDTFVPSRIAYLLKRVADRTRADMRIHIRLQRFDVVEYCEFERGGDATGAATAGGSGGLSRNAVSGDTVMMRLAGDVDGIPFDQSSTFDYGTMYRFPNPPSSSPEYLAQLRARLDLLVDVIINKVWDAELARKGLARK